MYPHLHVALRTHTCIHTYTHTPLHKYTLREKGRERVTYTYMHNERGLLVKACCRGVAHDECKDKRILMEFEDFILFQYFLNEL